MSTAMTLLGYGALPNGGELIAREQQRETGRNNSAMNSTNPDFPFSLKRDFSDEPIELAIQVTHYREPGNNRGLDHRDPNYDPGEVCFGNAVVVSTGKTIALTETEWEAVEEAFWK